MIVSARTLLFPLLMSASLMAPSMAEAQTAPPAAAQASGPLGYDQYKADPLQRLPQARAAIDQRLATNSLGAEERRRLERAKRELDRFAGLSPEMQDRQPHRRFEHLDADHDGKVDPAEPEAARQGGRGAALDTLGAAPEK